MPIYEYVIIEGPEKGKKIEHIHLRNEKPLKCCPKTGYKVKKIISVTGEPQFKGSGFYKTDYVKRSKKEEE